MPNPCRDMIAIVEATRPEICGQHSQIMLRMWHHLIARPERDVLLADFGGRRGFATLIQAFCAALPQRLGGDWPTLARPTGLDAEALPALEDAFARSLDDVLQRAGSPALAEAWRAMLHEFLAVLCQAGKAGAVPSAHGEAARPAGQAVVRREDGSGAPARALLRPHLLRLAEAGLARAGFAQRRIALHRRARRLAR